MSDDVLSEFRELLGSRTDKDGLYGEGEDYELCGALDDACDEIERLTAVVAGVHEAIGEDSGSDDDSLPQIVESVILAYRKRIEDIQCELAFKRKGHFDESCEWFKDKYIITEDDIDKAWHERSGVIHPHLSAETLGIVACSGCGGSGGHGSMEWGEGAMICATCNGRGWVRKQPDHKWR